MSAFTTLKEEAWEANQALVRQGLVIGTFGNASAFDRERGVCAIKPSGLAYEVMDPGRMVLVDMEGNVVEGDLNPSSDTKTHLEVYRSFPDIGGVAHTHSTYATAWAQAMKPIPILGTTHADFLAWEVPCTELMSDTLIQGDYETATGLQIVWAFLELSPDEIPMVLVACHGPFTWGTSASEAVHHSVVLEELARMAYLTLQIDPDTPSLKPSLIQEHYRRKHGDGAYYGQS